MTKINPDIHNIQKASDKSETQKSVKKDARFDKGFSGLLSEKLKTDETGTSMKQGSAILPEIEKTGSLRFSLTHPSAKTDDFGIESSLGLLEEYTALLMDPDRNLKEAYDALDRLLKSTVEMKERLLESGTTDDALQKIVDGITATARKEQIKMDRGDYIDPA